MRRSANTDAALVLKIWWVFQYLDNMAGWRVDILKKVWIHTEKHLVVEAMHKEDRQTGEKNKDP